MKSIKKIVCFLLIVSLVVVSVQWGTVEAATSFEDAATGFTLDDLGTDYTVVTPENFGITGETSYDADKQLFVNTDSGATSWNKTVFHGRVKFTGNTGHKLYFGVNIWAGLFISGNADGDLAYQTVAQGDANSGTITIENTKLTDEWLDFAVSIEIVTAGDAGSIKVGFFIDEELYNNQFITMSNVATAHFSNACNLFLSGNGGSTLSIAPLLAEDESTETTELTPLTFSSFGLDDIDITGWSPNAGNSGVNFENVVFNGYMKFVGEATRYMLVGNGWNGLQFCFTSTSIAVQAGSVGGSTWTIYPKDFNNMTSFQDVQFRFTFSLEKTNETDAILKVAINGIGATLGESESQVLTDAYSTSGNLQNIALYFSNATEAYPISIASYVENSEEDEEPVAEEHLRHLTLDDFGIASGTITAEAGKTVSTAATTKPMDNLMNTSISMKVYVTGASCNIQYATPQASNEWGLRLDIRDGSIFFVAVTNEGAVAHSQWLYPTGSTKDREFTLDIEMELRAAGLDGENNDVLVTILFDKAELYQVMLEDMKDSLGNGMAIFANYGKSDTSGASITVGNSRESATQFETLSLETIGQTAGVYDYKGSDGLQAGVNWTGSLDGKIFTSNVRFHSKHSQLFYGAPSSGSWYALQIGTTQPSAYEQDTVFTVQYPAGVFKFTRVIYAGTAGVQLANNTFELGISTRTVDSNGDDVFDDLELGIWFNGKLYNNSYIYLNSRTVTDSATGEEVYQNASELLGTSMAIRCQSKQGQVVLGNVTHTEQIDYCADDYVYFADSDAEVIINDTTYDEPQVLEKPGLYTVQTKDGDSTFTKNITLYVTNDATEDGKVDVRDLVALKRYAYNDRELGAAGTVAINPERAKNMDIDTAYDAMIDALLADENVIQAKQFADSIISTTESTGSGTFITSLGMASEGTSIIGISDEATANYQTDVTKFDGSGLDFVLDFDTNREIKVLQITDTQLMTYDKNKTGAANLTDFTGDLKDEVDQLVAENKPDLILVTGDLIYGQFDDSEGTLLNKLIEMMESYKIPWAPLLGNHEQETPIGTVEMCRRFVEDTSYCLFNRRHSIGGNGNYSIGLAIKGNLQRTIYMIDSRSCVLSSTSEKQAGIANDYTGFTDEQIAWYRTTAVRVNACATRNNNDIEKKISSFMCFHIPPAEVHTGSVEKGYQPTTDDNVNYSYDLGMESNDSGDFGLKAGSVDANANQNIRDYIYPYLTMAGTDGVFFGHLHSSYLSLNWKDIQWTFGLKTGAYDSNPEQTGGTLIKVNTDSTFTVEHKAITNRTDD